MVRITDAGLAAIKGAAPGHVAATRRYFFDLLSDQEIDTLTAAFDRVLANLGPGSDGDRQAHDDHHVSQTNKR